MTQKHRNGSREYTYEDVVYIIKRIEKGHSLSVIGRSIDRTKEAMKTFSNRWRRFKNGDTTNTSEKLSSMFQRYKDEQGYKIEPYKVSPPKRKKKKTYIPGYLILIFLVGMIADNLVWAYVSSNKTTPKAPVKERVVTVCAWDDAEKADAYRACNGKVAMFDFGYNGTSFTCK